MLAACRSERATSSGSTKSSLPVDAARLALPLRLVPSPPMESAIEGPARLNKGRPFEWAATERPRVFRPRQESTREQDNRQTWPRSNLREALCFKSRDQIILGRKSHAMRGLCRASSMGVGGGADGILILLAEDLNHSLEARLIAQLHVRQRRGAGS